MARRQLLVERGVDWFSERFWCGHCGVWVPKSLAVDKRGRKHCPRCGRVLRAKPHHKKKRKRNNGGGGE